MHRQNNFDFLRLFAASLVIIGHGFALEGHKPPMIVGAPVSDLGVWIFFTISGYLISASWDRDENLARFIAKRLLRLFPGLAIVVMLTAFLMGPIVTSLPQQVYWTHPVTYEYLSNIALHVQYFLPGLFAHNPIPMAVNGSLWSLPIEFLCYVLVPTIGVLALRKRLLAYFGLSLVFAMGSAYMFFYHQQQIVIYATDVRAAMKVMAYFCCGALFWILKNRIPYTLKGAALAIAVLSSLPFLSSTWMQVPAAAIYTITIVYITLFIADGGVMRLPNAAKFGDLSYGTYLYAFPVQQIIAQYQGTAAGIAGGIVVAFATVLPIAFLSWHCIEKRALAMKPTLSPRGQGISATLSEGSENLPV